MIKWLLPLCLFIFLPLTAAAQEREVIREGCMPTLDADDGDDGVAATRAARRELSALRTSWDPQKVYRQAVVLVEFSDRSFSLEHPRETYDSIFNYSGFNRGAGPGCVAEYFQEQSGGAFNVQFDVFGPYKVNSKARVNSSANEDTREYGKNVLAMATKAWIAEDKARDHSIYDWDNDMKIDQVIFVLASYSGNMGKDSLYGYVWPSTAEAPMNVYSIQTHDDYRINMTSTSSELRANRTSWGLGTIIHEYSHCFGLPDIYPTGSNAGYSVVDEWDLMDGGNFINSGWCPPNYSGLERMLLGWQSPIELKEPTTITDMKPLSEGGPVYMVRHNDSEYYLLENRQWSGWDARIPGRGLAVFHVVYSASKWANNSVNKDRANRCYQLVHADGLDYDAWDEIIGDNNPYVKGHSRFLSTSPYPYSAEESDVVNDQLTDTSSPASIMFNKNAAGSKYLSKAITNIRVSEDGLVSFDFMGGNQTGIEETLHKENRPLCVVSVYDMGGRCVGSRLESQRSGIYIIRYSDGSTRKVVKK